MANTTKATELSQLSSALQVDESTGEIIFTGSLSVDSNTLFIDGDANRVGIGTLTPGSALDVAGDVSVSGDLNVDSNTLFVDSANNRVDLKTTQINGDLLFNNEDSLITMSSENFINLRSDNLGSNVTINSSGYFAANDFVFGSKSNGAGSGRFFFGNGGTTTDAAAWKNTLTVGTNGDISFYEDTGTTPKFVWDASAERLGIGTSSPDATCSIHQDQNDTTSGTFNGPHLKLRALNTTNNTGFTGVSYSTSSLDNYGWTVGAVREATSGRSNFVFRNHINSAVGSERMRIDSFGNVGIGNSFPSSFDGFANDLAVGRGTGRAGITIYGDQSSSLSFADGTSGDERYAGYITYDHIDDELRFYVNYSLNTSPAAVITPERDFQFDSGYGSVATAYGCRAWVNFDGTGTVSIIGSGNVSSITDDAAGTYNINFTTSMPDNGYSAVVGGMRSSSTFHGHGVITVRQTSVGFTRLYSYDDVLGSGLGNLDLQRVTYAAFR